MVKNRLWSGTFVCIFNTSFSKILLLERKDSKGDKSQEWGNIGGSMELGETPLQACVREAREEIGVRLKQNALKLVQIKKVPLSEPHSQVIHFFTTSIDERTPIELDSESNSYKWFDLEKLPSRLLDDKKDILRWRNMTLSDKNQ